MKLHRFLSAVFLAAIITLPVSSHAGGKSKKPEPYVPLHMVIRSISDTSITISDGKQTRNYTVTPLTVIELKGNRAKVSDLQEGMAVSVTVGRTHDTVERIVANDPPKPPPVDKNAPKKKK